MPVRRRAGPCPPAAPTGIDWTAAAIATPTAPCGASPWSACTATKDYVARRTAEGRTKKEILRCLKRYAREIYARLLSPTSLGGR
jgi:hypothetical protein